MRPQPHRTPRCRRRRLNRRGLSGAGDPRRPPSRNRPLHICGFTCHPLPQTKREENGYDREHQSERRRRRRARADSRRPGSADSWATEPSDRAAEPRRPDRAGDRRRHGAEPQVAVRAVAQPGAQRRLCPRDDDPRAADQHGDRRGEHAPQVRWDPRAALAQGGRVGVHDRRHLPGQRPRRAGSAVHRRRLASATCGTSPPGCRTPFRLWPTVASSCWCSTAGTSPRTRRS